MTSDTGSADSEWRLRSAAVAAINGDVGEVLRLAQERCEPAGSVDSNNLTWTMLAAIANAQSRSRQLLSPAELRVLRFMSDERLSLSDISRQMWLSPNTVRTHIKNIYGKLDVSSREDAVERARELGFPNHAERAPMVQPLSAAELRVLDLLGDGGLNFARIATSLRVSQSTVKTHVGNIYNKLGVDNRWEAVQRAREMHLLLPHELSYGPWPLLPVATDNLTLGR